jgi:hypothetical protein
MDADFDSESRGRANSVAADMDPRLQNDKATCRMAENIIDSESMSLFGH